MKPGGRPVCMARRCNSSEPEGASGESCADTPTVRSKATSSSWMRCVARKPVGSETRACHSILIDFSTDPRDERQLRFVGVPFSCSMTSRCSGTTTQGNRPLSIGSPQNSSACVHRLKDCYPPRHVIPVPLRRSNCNRYSLLVTAPVARGKGSRRPSYFITALPTKPCRLSRGAIVEPDRARNDSHLRSCGNRSSGPYGLSSRVAHDRIPAGKSKRPERRGCQTCDTIGHSSRKTVKFC